MRGEELDRVSGPMSWTFPGAPSVYRCAEDCSRRVEPYSLRRTKDGNLLLFVVNDRGQLRGYRADRIAGVRPTDETFRPSFRVEF